MTEWKWAQRDAAERLAHVHYFSMQKRHGAGEVEFLIAVYEYITPKEPSMQFLARADRQVNQATAAYTPCGWGTTLLEALSACMDVIRKFPYEPEAEKAGVPATRATL